MDKRMNQRWWLITEGYQDDFREEWRKAHPNEQTPGYRLYKLRAKQFRQGESEYNGVKTPCTFLDPLSEEDLKLEKELEKAQADYRLQEELYIVDRVYDEIGWEEFLLDRDNCYYRDMIKVLTDYYVPCASADAQCSFDCPVYEVCKGNVEEMQKRKETIIEKFVAARLKNALEQGR